MPTHGYRDRGKYMCRVLPGLIHFRLVVHPLQSRVMGPTSGTGYLVPQQFAAGENRLYPDF
jgi:hypothetical protein